MALKTRARMQRGSHSSWDSQGNGKGEPAAHTASRALQCTNLLLISGNPRGVSRKEQTSHPWPQLRVTSASEHRAVHSLTASLRTCFTWKSNLNCSSLETAGHKAELTLICQSGESEELVWAQAGTVVKRKGVSLKVWV